LALRHSDIRKQVDHFAQPALVTSSGEQGFSNTPVSLLFSCSMASIAVINHFADFRLWHVQIRFPNGQWAENKKNVFGKVFVPVLFKAFAFFN
jgi:hypothetical protein